ncbi:MAG: hypothetical protein JRG86_09240 [Deltaproteobacteria bacterium]|jgi:hypothetical protein|nr:hypothetical protein [Deltaproteobacteria bacterium]MBW2500235.1 hypothetical protein [Deltaproteobacteria bacterium]
MQRGHEIRSRRGRWIERLVWNTAAAFMLTAMIAVLLCSLQWLDRIAPRHPLVEIADPLGPSARLEGLGREEPPALAEVGRPSG